MADTSRDQAIHWLLRQRAGDMDAAEWDAFTEWLEADETHAQLFDTLTASDGALDGLPAMAEPLGEAETVFEAANDETPEIEAANDNGLARFWPFAGVVAAMVALFFFWPSGSPNPALIATQPGETRQVAINDEITMTLNGGTEVALIQETTEVAITRGEVVFAIDATEPSPLRVSVGGMVLTDYGTVFNVSLSEDNVLIAVAEGVVGINPDRENISVPAGEEVSKSIAGNSIERREIDVDTVGTWREGRLEFDATPAREAVAMLERSTGAKITLSSDNAGEQLTGSLIVGDNDAETIAQFAAFLGASARKQSDASAQEVWLIE